ncbi:MAG: hypothetical protein V3T21_01090 [Candidatus Margulisiibacteriota bacterium]
MAILRMGTKILRTVISSIDIWRRAPNQVLEARFHSVRKGSPILWGATKTAQELSVLVHIEEGKINVSDIINTRIRKVFEQQGIEQIKMEGWPDIDAVHMMIIFKRAAAGMEEGLSHTYSFRSKDPFHRELIQLVKKGSILEVKRWLVERGGVY